MKLSLRLGAGIASLVLILCVAPSLVRDPSPAPARHATPAAGGSVAELAPATSSPASWASFSPQAALPPVPESCAGLPVRVTTFSFPLLPQAGDLVRIVAVSREHLAPFVAEVSGRAAVSTLEPADQWGPGPYAWEFQATALEEGEHSVTLRDPLSGSILGCSTIVVAPSGEGRARTAEGDEVWPVRRAWTGALEDLYSVWVARLFRTAGDSRGRWHRLHAVFRDPERNVLFGALGWAEDDAGTPEDPRPTAVRARADCGDLPYVLRAYFAWKLELPFRFQRCNRRNALQGAECYEERSNLTDRYRRREDPVDRFNRFLETWVTVGVHSATPRTLPEDDTSDFYPIEMTRTALRPGTVYVWPYGHLVVITDWVEDDVGSDAGRRRRHIDGTVTFKSFSPKNFPTCPGCGRSASRPSGRSSTPRGDPAVDNAGLSAADVPLILSEEQYRFRRSNDFYRAVWHVSGLFPDDPSPDS